MGAVVWLCLPQCSGMMSCNQCFTSSQSHVLLSRHSVPYHEDFCTRIKLVFDVLQSPRTSLDESLISPLTKVVSSLRWPRCVRQERNALRFCWADNISQKASSQSRS